MGYEFTGGDWLIVAMLVLVFAGIATNWPRG
jgi:hypothetical protein